MHLFSHPCIRCCEKVINQYKSQGIVPSYSFNPSESTHSRPLKLVGSLAIFVIILLGDLFILFLLIRLAPVTTVILL